MAERGSEKLSELFGGEKVSREDLAKALAGLDGRAIKRWWWYGQPAIDRIVATIQVEKPAAGRIIDNLVNSHSGAVQVGLEVFPLGIPVCDLVSIELQLGKNLKSLSQ